MRRVKGDANLEPDAYGRVWSGMAAPADRTWHAHLRHSIVERAVCSPAVIRRLVIPALGAISPRSMLRSRTGRGLLLTQSHATVCLHEAREWVRPSPNHLSWLSRRDNSEADHLFLGGRMEDERSQGTLHRQLRSLAPLWGFVEGDQSFDAVCIGDGGLTSPTGGVLGEQRDCFDGS
jgi:hypothetical protein